MSDEAKMLIDYLSTILKTQYDDENPFDFAKELKSLIKSHKFLREEALKTNEQMRKEMDEWRKAETARIEKVLEEAEWFSRGKLRSMTVGELADVLEDNERERD
jgi:hypothetical protein